MNAVVFPIGLADTRSMVINPSRTAARAPSDPTASHGRAPSVTRTHAPEPLDLLSTDSLAPMSARSVAAHADARGLSMLTPIARAEAQALLPAGFELAPIEGVPKDQHLLWVDFSEIKNGSSAVLGVDHRAISAGVGAAWGAAIGVGFGLAGGALSMGLLAPVTTFLGGTVGAKVGRAVGVAGSDAASRALGTYEEVLVTIPNVRKKGGTECYNLVLGMRLNSFLGLALEKAAGYGYNKVVGDCDVRPFEAYAVRGADGRPLFRASIAPQAADAAWSKPCDDASFATFRALTAQPFVGVVGPGKFAVSRLERSFDEASARVRRAEGRLEMSGGDFVPGVPKRSTKLESTKSSPACAFVFDGVHERLSWPTAVKYEDL